MGFTAALFGAQHKEAKEIGVENKPASLLVVDLGKALNKISSCICGRQLKEPNSYPSWLLRLTKGLADREQAHS